MKKNIDLNTGTRDGFYMPLAFRNKRKFPSGEAIILGADVGGTKTNMVLFQLKEARLETLEQESFFTKDHSSFEQLIGAFHHNDLPVIDALCVGVAGPVTKGRVAGTNFSWEIDEKIIKEELKVSAVSVINDMEANAYGLAALPQEDILELKPGAGVEGNAALISPGTGLGEAGLFWDGSHYNPFASEGGHCDFSPRNKIDLELWHFLKNKFDHVSWERVISGPGIFNIYQYLVSNAEEKEPDWIKEKMLEEDPAAVVSNCAANKEFPLCGKTMELFTTYLATEAAQMALKFKATGGVFIGGGILPRIIDFLDKDLFNKKFVAHDKMNALLELIPVRVILNPKTAVYGAAYCAALSLQGKE